MKQSLHTVNENIFTGLGTWNDFLTKSLENLLTSNNMDPEQDVSELEKKTKILESKRRKRGIQKKPTLMFTAHEEDRQSQDFEVPGFDAFENKFVTETNDHDSTSSDKIDINENVQNFTNDMNLEEGSDLFDLLSDNCDAEQVVDNNQNFQHSFFSPANPEVSPSDPEVHMETAHSSCSDQINPDVIPAAVSTPAEASDGGNAFAGKGSKVPQEFVPRRAHGKSPFKSAQDSRRKCRVSFKGFDDKKRPEAKKQFEDVPAAVVSKFENCKVQTNSMGGSSLYKAAMQHYRAGKFTASEEGSLDLGSLLIVNLLLGGHTLNLSILGRWKFL